MKLTKLADAGHDLCSDETCSISVIVRITGRKSYDCKLEGLLQSCRRARGYEGMQAAIAAGGGG